MQSIYKNRKTQWKVQVYIGHKPNGAHYFPTKQLAYDFYTETSIALLQSSIGGSVDFPLEVDAPVLRIAKRV